MAKADEPRKLLSDTFFGTELPKLEHGTKRSLASLAGVGIRPDPGKLRDICTQFFEIPAKGRYSGPITAGDGFFTTCFMAALRPQRMVEFGVSSGVSSAFFLSAAAALDLLREGTFLTGADITDDLGEGNKTGQVVAEKAADQTQNFDLQIGRNSFELLQDGDLAKALGTGRALAHIDADHCHPWPLIDVLTLYLTMPSQSWILMQDVQMLERWALGTILNGKPVPRPLRGPNITFTHWPGTKILGEDMCFNMGAIKLDIEPIAVLQFIDDCRNYETELGLSHLSDADPEIAYAHLEVLETMIRFRANETKRATLIA